MSSDLIETKDNLPSENQEQGDCCSIDQTEDHVDTESISTDTHEHSKDVEGMLVEDDGTQHETPASPALDTNIEPRGSESVIDADPGIHVKHDDDDDDDDDDGECESDQDAIETSNSDKINESIREQTDLPTVVDEVDKMNIEEEEGKRSSDDGEVSDENEPQSSSLPQKEDDLKTSSKSSDNQLVEKSAELDKPPIKHSESSGRKPSESRGNKAKAKASEMLLDMHGDELDYEEDVEHGEQQPGGTEEKGEIGEIEETKEEKKKTSDSELEEGEYDETEDGEIKDDEDEEGEVKDPHGRKPFVRQTCRFYQRGQCTWGLSCRFVHPGYNDKGNYMMIGRNEIHNLHASILAPPRPPTPPPEEELLSRPIIPEEPKVETAWEKGLRHAKEMRKKAQMRKEQDEDFEEKRLMAELSDEGDEDYNKENLYRNRDEFYGYQLGGDESPVREVVMKEPTLPQQYAATIHVSRVNRDDSRRGHGPPVPERSYDRNAKTKREDNSRQDKIRSNDSRNRIESKVPFVGRRPADSWQDPWARARSPKKVAGAKSRRRHSSHSSFSSSSSSRSRSSSYSSYTSRSRSSSSSFSSRSRSGSRSSRSYSRSMSRTPSPRSRHSAWPSSKNPSRTGPSANSQTARGQQSSRGRPPNRSRPSGASNVPSRSGQAKPIPSKSTAQSATKPAVSQASKAPVVKPNVVKKVEPVVLKVKSSSQSSKKLSIPPIHFQKQIKRVQPIADHLRPSKERSLSSSSRSSRSSRSSSRSGSSRSRSRSFSRSRSQSRSRSRSHSYSSISSRSRSLSRASSVSADSEHMYANLASPVSSASSDISDTPIPKEPKVKPVKISITKKSASESTKKQPTKTKQGIVKAKPSSTKQKVVVKAQQNTPKPVSNQVKKALPKSKAIKPLPDSHSSTLAKKTAKVTPMPATSITSKPAQKSKQPVVNKTSGTSSAAISNDRSDPLKYTAHKDIKLTLLKKPTETSKKRPLEVSAQSAAKKAKPPLQATKPKGVKEVKKPVANKPKTAGVNPTSKASNVVSANTTKTQEKTAPTVPQKPETTATQAKATVTKKGTKSRREELLKQLKEVEEAIARKRAKLAGT